MPSEYRFRSEKLELNFFSVKEAEHLKPRDTMALISLSDPEITPEIDYDKWKHHLQLRFNDVKDTEDGTVFSSQMADKIIEFVITLPEQISYIAIHCFAGVSRSGAVIKFLSKFIYPECYNQVFDSEYIYFNRTVYSKLCKAWNKRIKK